MAVDTFSFRKFILFKLKIGLSFFGHLVYIERDRERTTNRMIMSCNSNFFKYHQIYSISIVYIYSIVISASFN